MQRLLEATSGMVAVAAIMMEKVVAAVTMTLVKALFTMMTLLISPWNKARMAKAAARRKQSSLRIALVVDRTTNPQQANMYYVRRAGRGSTLRAKRFRMRQLWPWMSPVCALAVMRSERRGPQSAVLKAPTVRPNAIVNVQATAQVAAMVAGVKKAWGHSLYLYGKESSNFSLTLFRLKRRG
jgi:hypothetical protein